MEYFNATIAVIDQLKFIIDFVYFNRNINVYVLLLYLTEQGNDRGQPLIKSSQSSLTSPRGK